MAGTKGSAIDPGTAVPNGLSGQTGVYG